MQSNIPVQIKLIRKGDAPACAPEAGQGLSDHSMRPGLGTTETPNASNRSNYLPEHIIPVTGDPLSNTETSPFRARKSTGALTRIARIKLNERLWLRMRKDRVG